MGMKWSEIKEANKYVNYTHINCETPMGEFIIDWKGWKENPSYDSHINGDYIGTNYDLDGAKSFCEEYIKDKSISMFKYLKENSIFMDKEISYLIDNI